MESASSRMMPRRRIIELAGVGAMAGVVGWPNQADASLGSLVSHILGYLGRVLVPALLPFVGGELAKYIERNAQPRQQTPPHIDFHASFAPRLEIVGLQLPVLPSNWGYWVELNGIVRTDSQSPLPGYKDLNEWEMQGLPLQRHAGEVLYPFGERRKPDAADVTSCTQLCKSRKLDFPWYTLDYVRPFTSPTLFRQGIVVPGYCVSNPNGHELIVKV